MLIRTKQAQKVAFCLMCRPAQLIIPRVNLILTEKCISVSSGTSNCMQNWILLANWKRSKGWLENEMAWSQGKFRKSYLQKRVYWRVKSEAILLNYTSWSTVLMTQSIETEEAHSLILKLEKKIQVTQILNSRTLVRIIKPNFQSFYCLHSNQLSVSLR